MPGVKARLAPLKPYLIVVKSHLGALALLLLAMISEILRLLAQTVGNASKAVSALQERTNEDGTKRRRFSKSLTSPTSTVSPVFARLPIEIVDKILICAASPSVGMPCTISLLSQYHSRLVAHRLYKAVSLRSSRSFRLFRLTVAFHNPRLGKLVKALQIGSAVFDESGYLPEQVAEQNTLSTGVEQIILACPLLVDLNLDLFALSALQSGTAGRMSSSAGARPLRLASELTFSSYLKLPLFNRLRHLDLLSFGLDVQAAKSLHDSLPHLRTLDLRYVTQRQRIVDEDWAYGRKSATDDRATFIAAVEYLRTALWEDVEYESRNESKKEGDEDSALALASVPSPTVATGRPARPLRCITVYAWPAALSDLQDAFGEHTVEMAVPPTPAPVAAAAPPAAAPPAFRLTVPSRKNSRVPLLTPLPLAPMSARPTSARMYGPLSARMPLSARLPSATLVDEDDGLPPAAEPEEWNLRQDASGRIEDEDEAGALQRPSSYAPLRSPTFFSNSRTSDMSSFGAFHSNHAAFEEHASAAARYEADLRRGLPSAALYGGLGHVHGALQTPMLPPTLPTRSPAAPAAAPQRPRLQHSDSIFAQMQLQYLSSGGGAATDSPRPAALQLPSSPPPSSSWTTNAHPYALTRVGSADARAPCTPSPPAPPPPKPRAHLRLAPDPSAHLGPRQGAHDTWWARRVDAVWGGI